MINKFKLTNDPTVLENKHLQQTKGDNTQSNGSNEKQAPTEDGLKTNMNTTTTKTGNIFDSTN